MKVTFRKFPRGEVIAIFPDEVADSNFNLLSYQHVGQHGACSPLLLDELEVCTAVEIAPLLQELIEIGYEGLEVLE